MTLTPPCPTSIPLLLRCSYQAFGSHLPFNFEIGSARSKVDFAANAAGHPKLWVTGFRPGPVFGATIDGDHTLSEPVSCAFGGYEGAFTGSQGPCVERRQLGQRFLHVFGHPVSLDVRGALDPEQRLVLRTGGLGEGLLGHEQAVGLAAGNHQ